MNTKTKNNVVTCRAVIFVFKSYENILFLEKRKPQLIIRCSFSFKQIPPLTQDVEITNEIKIFVPPITLC